MKPVKNFKPNYSTGDRETLPAGNYIAQIIGAKAEEGKYCQQLIIQVEITEGEYAGFYKRDYESQGNSSYGQKYRGVLRINVPSGDGTQQDNFRQSTMERNIGAIEYSNEGYHWDWDEGKLKGKKVGIRVREHSKVFDDGREATWTEIGALCAVNGIEKLKVMKAKNEGQRQQEEPAPAAPMPGQSAGWTDVTDDDDLPF